MERVIAGASQSQGMESGGVVAETDDVAVFRKLEPTTVITARVGPDCQQMLLLARRPSQSDEELRTRRKVPQKFGARASESLAMSRERERDRL